MATSNIARKKVPTFTVVYTIAEAARLCGLSAAQVRRWVRRYSFHRGEKIQTSPFGLSQRLSENGTVGLDFLDLIEIRYVKAFIEADVSWPVLRAAHAQAAAMLRVDHPFATKKFFTDGQTILMKIAEPALHDLMGNQLVFSRILERYLAGAEGLDFDDRNLAVRWWPMGRKRLVVIDPERSFGQPIVSTEGVPTAVLYKAYLAESSGARNGETRSGANPTPVVRFGQSTFDPKHPTDKAAIARVANWYVVEERSVKTAIEYESVFLAVA
jgi:hypothetical protein